MRRRIMVMAVAVFMLLGGCSIGDIRRPPPRPPAPSPQDQIPQPDEVRRAPAPVPPSYELRNVEFVDQSRGYALFSQCGPRTESVPAPPCAAAVVRTDDGGRSWHQVFHPHSEGRDHQMYADSAALFLYVDGDGWYMSRDAGVHYEHSATVPTAYRAGMGEFQVCCESDKVQRVVRVDGDRMTPTKGQPAISDLRTAGSSLHWVFAVGVGDIGRPFAAVSSDRGDSWRQVPVAGSSGIVAVARISVDHDGTYAWLVGQPDLLSWPALWFFDGQGWRPVAATGHPEQFTSAVALEDASLAVTTPDGGPGIVTGGVFQKVDWPIGSCYLRLLADGTLFCSSGEVSWLGIGKAADRRWIKILLGGG